jgi:hypothetical protein
MIYAYANGRKFNPGERMLFAAAARDERLAQKFEAFGTRSIGPARMFATTLPRALLVNARHRRSEHPGGGSRALEAGSA